MKGYTPEYLEASSPRRQQIEEAIARSGFSGPEAAQIAAHNTRDKKEIHTAEQVLAAHRQIALEFGNQADQVVQAARLRAEILDRNRVPDVPQRAQEAVSYAKDRNFEREAVTDERDIMRDALRRGMGDLTYDQVRDNFNQRQGSGEFQTVQGGKHETGRQFTTRETIAAEQANLNHMRRGQNAVEPIMSDGQAKVHAATRDFLNPAQRGAIEEVLTTRDRIHGLQGLAGTGKTTTLEAIREGAERCGYVVEGFAPTSRAAGQLRDAGISADTLQGFLARGGVDQAAGCNRHLYMVDESSLASTRQMRAFLDRIGPQDRALLIGDTRQHQGVDAGKPFEQMQDAGMQTAQLDRIMRQKDPELLRAVEHLSKNETSKGVELLQQQGRITEISDRDRRIEVIAKDYAAKPANTLVVSPDNASLRDINEAIRKELKSTGAVSKEDHRIDVLTQRSELTSADRSWAAKYQLGDLLYYTRGSKQLNIERGSYATVVSVDAGQNRLTVKRPDGEHITYDPKRLQGITAYREIERDFSVGDRLQFTASRPGLDVKNRDLGTVQEIEGTVMTVRLDGEKGRTLTFDSSRMRHFDHGYAVTSHSSQGLTTNRVLVNMDTTAHPGLINTRFAYVSISRASQDARIYTNDAATLGECLNTDIGKTSAIEVARPKAQKDTQIQPKGQRVTNTNVERLKPTQGPTISAPTITHTVASPSTGEADQRHYAPLQAALPNEAPHYEWKRETGTIQTYQHIQSGGRLHLDLTGQFYDRHAQPVTRENALEHAANRQTQSGQNMRTTPADSTTVIDYGLSL